MTAERYLIGVDVGTASVRAGLFDVRGKMLAMSVQSIKIWHPKPDHAEQSSADIWKAVCKTTQAVCSQAGIPPFAVAGISFDATCSLVVLDIEGNPLPVNEEGEAQRNIIMWMDHRALEETEQINAGKHAVLRYVGGRLSPEMEIPKLKWLKTHVPETWSQAGKFFDLADYLTWKAAGADVRSLCTLVCKWTYLGHEGKRGKWDRSFLKKIGLNDLFENGRVGDDVRPMGSPIGELTPESAKELGLTTSCQVGVGIIDAHAGGLGLLGAAWSGKGKPRLQDLESALAMIGGTSCCHMAVSREPLYIDGIWGPYYGAMVPGMWLTEGGQSAAGSAIDQVISSHPNAPALEREAKRSGRTVYEILNDEVARIQSASGKGPEIAKDIHVLPDFIGNRSPKADPHVRGLVDGLSLDRSLESQALLYYAAIQAVAYGTRDIIQSMNRAGYRITNLYVTGGGTKNPLWLQEHADATGCTLHLAKESEAVLLGAAVLAATAAEIYPDIYRAMQSMSGSGAVVKPNKDVAAYHKEKFKHFRALYVEQAKRRAAMAAF